VPFCINCGKQISSQANFCKYCGKGVKKFSDKDYDAKNFSERNFSTEEPSSHDLKNFSDRSYFSEEPSSPKVYPREIYPIHGTQIFPWSWIIIIWIIVVFIVIIVAINMVGSGGLSSGQIQVSTSQDNQWWGTTHVTSTCGIMGCNTVKTDCPFWDRNC